MFTRLAVRASLIVGSLASGSLFWVRAALGQNQLAMHDCSDGAISIGGVSEQLYGEGFLLAWHDVLGRELGERSPQVLYEVGFKGAEWEVRQAIAHRTWVPRLLRPFVGKPALLEKCRESPFYRALTKESLRILFRMVMTEGGWGVVEEIDLMANPVRLVVRNTPEPRRLARTGRCECHLMTGIYAAYLGTIFGTAARGTETTCVARGDERCTFAVALGLPSEEKPVVKTPRRLQVVS